MTNEQFDRIRRLSLSLTGIVLADRHRKLLASRCRRLKIDRGSSLDALLGASEIGDPSARQQLIGLLTISYTSFFRNASQFEITAEHGSKAIQNRGTARFWSAAAATGEEPYSLAMALIAATRRDDPPVSILATDINPEVLEMARRGEYGEAAIGSLNEEQRARFFSGPAGPARWRISDAVRRLVTFLPLNLSSELWPVEGPFDVIFCRNLLMYMEPAHRHTILKRMASLIAADGLLVLDPAEHLGESQHLFGPARSGIYTARFERIGIP